MAPGVRPAAPVLGGTAAARRQGAAQGRRAPFLPGRIGRCRRTGRRWAGDGRKAGRAVRRGAHRTPHRPRRFDRYGEDFYHDVPTPEEEADRLEEFMWHARCPVGKELSDAVANRVIGDEGELEKGLEIIALLESDDIESWCRDELASDRPRMLRWGELFDGRVPEEGLVGCLDWMLRTSDAPRAVGRFVALARGLDVADRAFVLSRMQRTREQRMVLKGALEDAGEEAGAAIFRGLGTHPILFGSILGEAILGILKPPGFDPTKPLGLIGPPGNRTRLSDSTRVASSFV
ncbi:hypothetical protein DFJ74DRAFT_680889 [Hyaloraphidium curvatum]|nr:hypothetical protein DFJ74DRAFT_680889 [Hyaloraphidium curvatum]